MVLFLAAEMLVYYFRNQLLNKLSPPIAVARIIRPLLPQTCFWTLYFFLSLSVFILSQPAVIALDCSSSDSLNMHSINYCFSGLSHYY